MPILLLIIVFVVGLYSRLFGHGSGPPMRSANGSDIIVRDGDTIAIERQDYRLLGIDAPEFSQICKTADGSDWPCGKQARAELSAVIAGRKMTCAERARDKYNRIVATCTDSNGNDIAQMMVERGFAVRFGGFGDTTYAIDEVIARTARRGVWQGVFERPSVWRAAHPRAPIANR